MLRGVFSETLVTHGNDDKETDTPSNKQEEEDVEEEPFLEEVKESRRVVRVRGVGVGPFRALLEYIYTDHVDLGALKDCGDGEESEGAGGTEAGGGGSGGDSGGGACNLLALADRFDLPRLVCLCELFISKAVEKATAASVRDAPVNVPLL